MCTAIPGPFDVGWDYEGWIFRSRNGNSSAVADVQLLENALCVCGQSRITGLQDEQGRETHRFFEPSAGVDSSFGILGAVQYESLLFV